MGLKQINQQLAYQKELIAQQHAELDQRQNSINQEAQKLQQVITEFQAQQHFEIRRQAEQSIDFALRSLPWYKRSQKNVMALANTYFEQVKEFALLKSVQAMADQLKKDGVDLMAENEAEIKEIKTKMDIQGDTGTISTEQNDPIESNFKNFMDKVKERDNTTFSPQPEDHASLSS